MVPMGSTLRGRLRDPRKKRDLVWPRKDAIRILSNRVQIGKCHRCVAVAMQGKLIFGLECASSVSSERLNHAPGPCAFGRT